MGDSIYEQIMVLAAKRHEEVARAYRGGHLLSPVTTEMVQLLAAEIDALKANKADTPPLDMPVGFLFGHGESQA